MSYIPKNKWWHWYQKQCTTYMNKRGFAEKDNQQFARMVDPTISHTLKIVRWLISKQKEGEIFYWGDGRCICEPETNGIFIKACEQEKQNIFEILCGHPIADQFKWVKCEIIKHQNHLNEVNRVDISHYPKLYANNVQMIIQINKEAKQNVKYKVYANAIRLYQQSLKRSNEFIWETDELKLYYQLYIHKQLFVLTKNDIYFMIKHYKEIEQLMYQYMTKDIQKQLNKTMNRI
eukprot:303950_1